MYELNEFRLILWISRYLIYCSIELLYIHEDLLIWTTFSEMFTSFGEALITNVELVFSRKMLTT